LVSRKVLRTSREQTGQARFARVSFGGGRGQRFRPQLAVGAAKPRLGRIANEKLTRRRQRGFATLHDHLGGFHHPSKAPKWHARRRRARQVFLDRSPQDFDRNKRSEVLMGTLPQLGLLSDTVSTVESFVDVFIGVYILLILAFIIMSWVRLPYSVWLNRIQRFLYDICDPYLRVFRRFVPPLGPLDLSPMLAVIVLIVLQQVIHAVLNGLR
jgi:YggT family protein